jgi:hypothetical protein
MQFDKPDLIVLEGLPRINGDSHMVLLATECFFISAIEDEREKFGFQLRRILRGPRMYIMFSPVNMHSHSCSEIDDCAPHLDPTTQQLQSQIWWWYFAEISYMCCYNCRIGVSFVRKIVVVRQDPEF